VCLGPPGYRVPISLCLVDEREQSHPGQARARPPTTQNHPSRPWPCSGPAERLVDASQGAALPSIAALGVDREQDLDAVAGSATWLGATPLFSQVETAACRRS
jgi:hypothetical protein